MDIKITREDYKNINDYLDFQLNDDLLNAGFEQDIIDLIYKIISEAIDDAAFIED